MVKKKKFSMRPEAAEEGLFGNCEGTIISALYGTYGEHGNEKMIVGNRTAEDPVAVVEFEMEGSEEPAKQFFSCGSATRLVPSEDGEEPASEGPFLIPAENSTATGLNKQTNLYQFLHSLQKPAEGKLKFNTASLDEKGLDALVGLRGFFVRVPAPRISTIAVEEGARERTILLCQEIYELPGKAGKKAKVEEEEVEKKFPKAKGKKVAEEEEEGEDEVTEEAQRIVVAALEKAGDGGIEKDQLVKKIFGAATKSKHRKAILEMAQDDEFIADGPWNYDEKSETLTAIE